MKKFLLLLLFATPVEAKPIHLNHSDIVQLSKTLYMEDRQHGQRGMITIAHLVFNRSRSTLFPKSISKIIHQRGQFTSWKHPKVNVYSKEYKIAKSSVIKSVSLYNHGIDYSNHALYYVRKDCHPSWRKKMKVTTVFGVHVFMKPRKNMKKK